MRIVPMVNSDNSKSDIFSKLLDERIILVTGEVTDEMAELVMAQLLYLQSENSQEDIKMYINSPGGSVPAGLAIYDTMKIVKCDIQTICVGMAASMGSILLAGGTKGKRFATENAEVMIHQPSGGAQGKEADVVVAAERMTYTRNRLESLLAKFTGKTLKKINADCALDKWFSAEEAKKYGLIDDVITV
jgi:ATP-dependent Clp protease protease subunit